MRLGRRSPFCWLLAVVIGVTLELGVLAVATAEGYDVPGQVAVATHSAAPVADTATTSSHDTRSDAAAPRPAPRTSSGVVRLVSGSDSATKAGKGLDLDALSAAGRVPAKGGRSAAGRSYQKHMDRSELPTVPGKSLDHAGQDLLDDILTHPGSKPHPVTGGDVAGGTRVIRPDGTGATFNPDGSLAYVGVYK